MSHESGYGGGDVTAAQRLAEIACERVAARDGRTLPDRFWSDERWKAAYRRQILAVNRLLKLYDEEAVFRALRNNPRAFAIRSDFFVERVRAEQDSLDGERLRAERAAPIETSDTSGAPRRGPGRGGVRGKLKNP